MLEELEHPYLFLITEKCTHLISPPCFHKQVSCTVIKKNSATSHHRVPCLSDGKVRGVTNWPGLDAASTDVQVSVAHPPLDLLLTCDASVSMKSTFVMSS